MADENRDEVSEIEALRKNNKELLDQRYELMEQIRQLRPVVEKMKEALTSISLMGLDPEMGQIVGSEHYEKAWLDCMTIAREALAEAEKVLK